jgi:lipopolysaccharide export system permease protein
VAREARFVSARTWEFVDARVLEFAAEGMKSERVEAVRIDLGVSGADVARAQPALIATSLHRLARRIREHRGDAASLAGLRVSFHARLAQPLSVLILVLIAIPFAIGDLERGDSLARALLWSLGGAALYWVAWTLALAVGRSGALPPAAPPWGITVGFLAAGAWRFRTIRE